MANNIHQHYPKKMELWRDMEGIFGTSSDKKYQILPIDKRNIFLIFSLHFMKKTLHIPP